jgi:hypothetical protein
VRHMARARALAVQMGNEFLDLVHGKGLVTAAGHAPRCFKPGFADADPMPTLRASRN